jgi:hypothetical protein
MHPLQIRCFAIKIAGLAEDTQAVLDYHGNHSISGLSDKVSAGKSAGGA